jgi:zinc protease
VTLKEASEFITVPGKTNVEVRMGNVIPITPLHVEYAALDFGIDVLGKVGGFSGRLMSTVREKAGLTYGIYATTVDTNPQSTIHWNVYTFLAAKDLAKGLSATRNEIKRIVRKGITSKELSTFKDILRNQYLIAHESNMRRLSTYHTLSVLGYSETILIERVARMQKLTLPEVNKALIKYIDPHNLVTSGAGPVSSEGKGIL